MHGRLTKIIANSLAVVVIAGSIATMANSLRVCLAARDIYGPTVLTTDAEGEVYTNIATTRHVLDAGGVREDSIPLAEQGLQKEQVSSRTRRTLVISCIPSWRRLHGCEKRRGS